MTINEYIASGIVEAYVMGLCSAEEEREFEQMRLQYPELDAAVNTFEYKLEERLKEESLSPSASVNERILSGLGQLAGKIEAPTVRMAQKKTFNWKWLAAASFLLFVASAIFNWVQFKNNSRPFVVNVSENGQTLPAQDYAIMLNPSITPVAMYGQGFHSICRCTLFWDKKTGKAYLMIHHLPQSSDSKDFQLWAMVDGKPVSAGIVKDDIRGRFIELNNIPPGTAEFMVTLEKAGGAAEPGSDLYLKGEI
ncbi:MAG: anti-sigma factor [Ferruginibacter sp.]